ncbi:hypothetical protein CYLTODRAFT_143793 [Cylindrobasidium torrendii FP15055 ss-10]|uniref:histidine kinase n=1 Tax=Cylindrobasidium torrendii FP15055 ss-10 TaxID=1314674 RepID=A0A0D7BLM5_9AGAR|nr:hypothetical protein CYLTODRAFT_143793 [Cylindrobasidium torrendii FP15055 ss-10]
MNLDDLPLLPVLDALPPGHPAAIYDAESHEDTRLIPAWTNKAFRDLNSKNLLPLRPESKRQLDQQLSVYAHSALAPSVSLVLSLTSGQRILSSLQIHGGRWIIMMGYLKPSPTLISGLDDELLGPIALSIKTHDWASTSLGPIQNWPSTLQCVVSTMMVNPFESCIFWGKDRTLLFNDSWAKGSASKPGLMGQSGRVAFREIWETFSTHCDLVFAGQNVSREDDLLFFEPSTSSADMPALIESYYSWSYVPVRIEDGSVGGILNNCMDTTRKVISERRMRTIVNLAERTGQVKTTHEFWAAVLEALRPNEYDFPYALCYMADTALPNASSGTSEESDTVSVTSESTTSSNTTGHGSVLTLVGTLGVIAGHSGVAPHRIVLSQVCDGQQWPFAAACTSTQYLRCSNPCPEAFEARGWPGDVAGGAVMLPLLKSDAVPSGLLIFGLNTRRPYDDEYKGFHGAIINSIRNSLSVVQSIEYELRRAEEAQALDRAKNTFFQNVSHELRTPLTLIRGPCEDALKSGTLDTDNLARLKYINGASLRLLRLVNTLLLFSSAEARRLRAHFSPVRLGSKTADLASLFRSVIEKAGISYSVECGSEDDDVDEQLVYVDQGMWEKIIFNLLSNAVKYTRIGFINVTLSFTSTEVILKVQDSGCGIPEEDIDKVLLRFHRVDSSRGRSHEGTGIGLALTHELVKIHGGVIRIQSRLGIGSTFTVKLPLGSSHLPQKDVHHIPHDQDDDNGRYAKGIVEEVNGWMDSDDSSSTFSQASSESSIDRSLVLLVEDNADARAYIKSIIIKAGQDVAAVADGVAALEYISDKGRPDLIVTDIMMPRMNGLELLSALENHPDPNIQAIAVIVLSARGDTDVGSRSELGLFQGPVDFLAKPFTATELLSRVKTRLRAVRQRQSLERQSLELEKQVRVEQERYQRMSELSPVAIFETDESDRDLITYANETFFSLVGISRALPLHFNDVLSSAVQNHVEAAQRAWNEALCQGKEAHFDFVFSNGRNAFVEIICLSDGRLLGTLTDQTEQRRLAAEQLNSEREKADDAVHQRRLQEAFIDIVSHELRNPLSAIIQGADVIDGSVQRLQRILIAFRGMLKTPESAQLFVDAQIDLDDAKLAVASVSLCARHQTIIASDILAVSRLDSGLLSVTAVNFWLLDELNAVLRMYSIQSTSQGISVVLKLDDSINNDTTMYADPTRLCQILVNLITNSCRILETWEGPRVITIDCALLQAPPFGTRSADMVDDGSQVFLSIRLSDSGPGIPLDDQARLFTRFNDINSGNGARRSTSVGGTGLGLYLCKKLAELQGGQIRHISAPGEGAAFHFFIEGRRGASAGVRRLLPEGRSASPLPRLDITPPRSSNESSHGATAALPNSLHFSANDFPPRDTPPQGWPNTSNGTTPSSNGTLNHIIPLRSPLPPNIEVPRASMLVLIVEDNLINQRLLRRQLEKALFQVDTANNGLEALQFLERCLREESDSKPYPSVVLMDLEMPVLDGIEATSRIREWEQEGRLPASRLPIFAITGNARKGQIDSALNVGMDHVFTKPYKVAEIIQQIDLEGFPR